MAEEDRTFNYNDLNLDFLELSPPRARPVVRKDTPIASSPHFRPSAFKAKQLAQKVVQNDVLVKKIELLNGEHTALKQKLKDFQKSASQIQELYESEKKKCSDLHNQFKEVELNSSKIQKRCTQLHNDLEDKKLQLEQLQAQTEDDKGPLSYTELAMKYLKLFQHLDEEILSKAEKTLYSELCKYCEEKGYKSAVLRLVKVKKKRNYKKSKDVQCNLVETDFQTKAPNECKAQSTQTSIATYNCAATQTADLPLLRHMQTQTLANEELKPVKALSTQAVQTTAIEVRSQGTQHISITTTRGTSTSCFIKKHNVGTCFPEPNFVSPVAVMVEELLQLYNVSPLSPISDPVPPTAASNQMQDIPTIPLISQELPVTYKSTGTCTYLCNVQRQIDFIPIYASIKRSQSSSPSPTCACLSIKNEAYATPTPSPPPQSQPPRAQRPQSQSLPAQVSTTATIHNESATESSASLNDNLSNMQPMLNAFTQLPEMQPEVFSTIWQMAGQMFMGLLYAPTNNRLRAPHLNRSNSSIDQQQFHNWLYTLYESMQQPLQHPTTTSPEITHSASQRDGNGSERNFDSNSETDSMNMMRTSQQEEAADIQEVYNDSTNVLTNSDEPVTLGADESTQTDTSSDRSQSMNLEEKLDTECIFKEPLEIPKRSVKQARKRKNANEELTYMKKSKGKQIRKKRKREKQKKMALRVSALLSDSECSEINDSIKEKTIDLSALQQDQSDFATAVEFCANLHSFNSDAEQSTNENGAQVYISTSGDSTESTPLLHDLSNGEFECATNAESKKGSQCDEDGHSRIESYEASGLRVDVTNGNVKYEDENVPEVKLPGPAKNHCDKLDNIDTVHSAASQSASNIIGDTAYRIKVDCESSAKQIKDVMNSLFGNDTNDKDFMEVHAKNIQKSGHDEERSNINLVLDESPSPLNSIEVHAATKSIEKYHDNAHKTKDVSSDALSDQSETKNSQNITDSLPSILISQSKVLKNEEPRSDINSVEQILLDLSMSESEDEENIESLAVKSSIHFKNEMCAEDSEEADEQVLIIVEEDFECNSSKRTNSESSAASDLAINGNASNSLLPAKNSEQTSDSDTDVSGFLDSTIVDNLLDNTSARKLCKSILNDEANKETDALLPPRKCGRKRNNELSNVTFCKRSARLRAKQNNDSDYRSDESLSPPYKKYSNEIPSTTNDEQLTSFTELKQKVLPNDVSSQGHIETVNESIKTNGDDHIFTDSSERISSKTLSNASCTNFLSSCSELSESASKNCQAQLNQRLYVSHISPSNINQNGYESPVSPPNIKQNCQDSPASPPLFTNISGIHQCRAIPLELKRSYFSTYEQSAESCQSQLNQTDYESPTSPPNINQSDHASPASPEPNTITANNTAHILPCPEIPLELNREHYSGQRRSILQHVINNYSADIYTIVTGKKKRQDLDCKIALQLEKFLNTTQDRVDALASAVALSLHEDIDDTEMIAGLIVDQLISAPRPNIELNCELASVPPKYIGTHLRLISIVLRHLQYKRPDVAGVLLTKIENKLFNYQNNENIKIEAALNLTQLYLLVIPLHKSAEHNPARLFIAKSLYYFNVLAAPIIYEVLLWYPTTLPSREETHYDRSDALITVIQHFLMCTTYNMDTKDLRHKELLSLLRFEYHFEPFKPKALEVLSNLVSKLKAGNLSNLKYAFAIFCKRQTKLVDILLQQQLLPLADEYYKLVQNTNEYDERIAALLECISAVVKPLSLDTDVSLYHSIFEQFLVAVQRPVVQEAAVLAILRLQRFGQARCFHALAHFRPHYSLQLLTSNSLKTFIHKKPLSYWKNLLLQSKH